MTSAADPTSAAAEALAGRPAMPRHVTLENTSACNLRCFMCEHHRPGVHKADVMGVDLFGRVLEEAAAGADFLSLTVTGDPFVDPHLPSRIEAIRRHPELSVEIVTNGMLLDRQRLSAFAGIRNPLYFSVSLDTLDETAYRSIRSEQADLKGVLKNLSEFRALAGELGLRKVGLNLSSVLMKRTVLGLVEFVERAGQLGCDSVGLSHLTIFEPAHEGESLFRYPGLCNRMVDLARKRAEEIGLRFHAPPPFAVTPEQVQRYRRQQIRTCPFLASRVYVGHEGRLEACCHSRPPVMGNVARTPLGGLWTGPMYAQFITALWQGKPMRPCDCCYVLELYKEFLHDSRPFGLDMPPEGRVAGEAVDFQAEGFFDPLHADADKARAWAGRYLQAVQGPARTHGAVPAAGEPAVTTPPAAAYDKSSTIARIVRCPACYAPVVLQNPDILCQGCGTAYRFEGPCPVLMTAEDRRHLNEFLGQHARQTVPAIQTPLRRKFFPPGPCHDPRRPERLKRLWQRFPLGSVVLDVGAQNARLREDIITLDLAPFDGVDLVGNALRMPLASDSVDLIINTGVLEHVENVEKVVAEFHRVLRPGGVVYTEIPFMQGYHPDPTDFQRLTYQGLRRTFEAFVVEEMEVSSGPFLQPGVDPARGGRLRFPPPGGLHVGLDAHRLGHLLGEVPGPPGGPPAVRPPRGVQLLRHREQEGIIISRSHWAIWGPTAWMSYC